MEAILETDTTNYILLKKIGIGATCIVYKGYSKEEDSHKLYAIKIFKSINKKYFEKEILINDVLPKKYFLPIVKHGFGLIHKEKENLINSERNLGNIFYIVQEIADNGELFNYVLEKAFSEQISAKVFIAILKSVKILHEKYIIHGDIKPENILVGKDFSLKLIDFGFSQIFSNKSGSIINNTEGSIIYSSPEIRKGNIRGYDGIKSDVFSLGVLLFVMTVGRFPFHLSGYSDKKYRLIMTKKYNLFWANYESLNLSKEFKDLINHLICFEPKERLSIEEIFEHPWIKKNVISSELNKNEIVIDEDIIKELKMRKDLIAKKRTN